MPLGQANGIDCQYCRKVKQIKAFEGNGSKFDTSLPRGESGDFGGGVVNSESTKTTTSLPIQNIILGSGHLAYCGKYMLNPPNPKEILIFWTILPSYIP